MIAEYVREIIRAGGAPPVCAGDPQEMQIAKLQDVWRKLYPEA